MRTKQRNEARTIPKSFSDYMDLARWNIDGYDVDSAREEFLEKAVVLDEDDLPVWRHNAQRMKPCDVLNLMAENAELLRANATLARAHARQAQTILVLCERLRANGLNDRVSDDGKPSLGAKESK